MRPFNPDHLCDVLIGSRKETSPQFSVLGDLIPDQAKGAGTAPRERRVGIDHNAPSSILLAGLQGAGKSYTLTCIAHGFLQPIPGVNKLPKPGSAVFIHWHRLPTYKPEILTVLYPNTVPDQVKLLGDWGGKATAMRHEDVVLLCPPGMEGARRAEFPGLEVLPLRFTLPELTNEQRQVFLGCDNTAKQTLATEYLNEILSQNRDATTLEPIEAALNSPDCPLSPQELREIRFRLKLLQRFITTENSFASQMRSGRLVVVDLRDPFLHKSNVQRIIIVLLQQIGAIKLDCGKMAIVDEAHAIMGDPDLDIALTDQARLMRHTGTTMVLASQSLKDMPLDLIEMSNIVITHRYDSPRWHSHLRAVKGAYDHVQLADQMALGTGEGFLWSSRTTDAAIRAKPARIRIRISACMPGGETVFATGAAQ